MADVSFILEEKTNFRMYKGDSVSWTLTVLDGAGSPFDFTGATLALTVQTKFSDTANVFQLTVGSGITVASNVLTFTISKAISDTLSVRRYVYDLQYTSSGGVPKTWQIGGLNVEEKVL